MQKMILKPIKKTYKKQKQKCKISDCPPKSPNLSENGSIIK